MQGTFSHLPPNVLYSYAYHYIQCMECSLSYLGTEPKIGYKTSNFGIHPSAGIVPNQSDKQTECFKLFRFRFSPFRLS